MARPSLTTTNNTTADALERSPDRPVVAGRVAGKPGVGEVSDAAGSQRLMVCGDERARDGFLNTAIAGALPGAAGVAGLETGGHAG